MRIALIPAASESEVFWRNVVRVSMESDGRNPAIVLHYRNGAVKRISVSQAIDLWRRVEEHKVCEEPCFYRHECDCAPTEPACTCCQLAEVLAGLDFEQRPDRVEFYRRPMTAHGCLYAVLLGVIVALVWAKGQSPAPLEKFPNARVGANARHDAR